MSFARFLTVLTLAGTFVASANAYPSQDTTQAPAASSSGSSSLTGCLKGKQGQYYLVGDNGTRTTLQAKGQDLSKLVGHQVTVTGKADTSRAVGSDAQGHHAGYFSVDSVNDQGPCKK